MTPEKKVAVIIGTRPEAIKMAPLVLALKDEPSIRALTVLTAQHREMSDEVLELFGIVPDYDLDIMKPAQTLDETTGRLITRLAEVFDKEEPDMVLVQGDTTSTFVGALAAHYRKIPVGHIEAGLRTEDKHNPFPEEMNRRLTSSLTDIHFPPTETASNALLAEGVDPATVHVTGNTVIDALLQTLEGSGDSSGSLPAGPDPSRRWITVTSHRRENWGEPLESICHALLDLVDRFDDIDVIYPVHPNPRVRETTDRLLSGQDRIHLIAPLDYVKFVHLMNASYLLITDSGGVQEEAPSLGKPVLVIRLKTERPEAVEAGTVRLVGTDRDTIVGNAAELLESQDAYESMSKKHNPYGDGKACPRIVAAILDWWKE